MGWEFLTEQQKGAYKHDWQICQQKLSLCRAEMDHAAVSVLRALSCWEVINYYKKAGLLLLFF